MLYAGVVGAILVVAGIIGFFYKGDFTSDESSVTPCSASSTSTAGTTSCTS